MLAYEEKVKAYEQEKIRKLKERGETITIEKKKERQMPTFLQEYMNQPAQLTVSDEAKPTDNLNKKKLRK